ncbi:hypothetical protein LOK49_LG14G00974 [Camellia lanceoleosa]|uniref:Uncharacterized protein n=1 Tax=Camellia lanceoleosa TaxID=1840588 RepID=A0ACC0FET4_9ERIC|nr:hypothetical protein LOK49_LG14G00974 [Camellia lanceoleosa]
MMETIRERGWHHGERRGERWRWGGDDGVMVSKEARDGGSDGNGDERRESKDDQFRGGGVAAEFVHVVSDERHRQPVVFDVVAFQITSPSSADRPRPSKRKCSLMDDAVAKCELKGTLVLLQNSDELRVEAKHDEKRRGSELKGTLVLLQNSDELRVEAKHDEKRRGSGEARGNNGDEVRSS